MKFLPDKFVDDGFENYDLDALEGEERNLTENVYIDPDSCELVVRFPIHIKFLILKPVSAQNFIDKLQESLNTLTQ